MLIVLSHLLIYSLISIYTNTLTCLRQLYNISPKIIRHNEKWKMLLCVVIIREENENLKILD